ncbi:ABC transporter permease [Fulvivirga sp.]|uniref:ABC transporter permease n=1 Tax=Fulvivirga sp. TaxID=1931237 RepID=UPI0032F0752D
MKTIKQHPPKLPLRFFRWFCNPDFIEDIEGDLLERFEHNVNEKSVRHARWTFAKDVIRLFRPGIIKPLFSNQQLNDSGMLKNYFTIAIRSLLKQKLYSTINIGGLSIGITCFTLIFIYVQHELSYDNFYPEKEKIHRIYQQQAGNMFFGSDYFSMTPAALANKLTSDYPEVEYATSIQNRHVLIKTEKDNFLDKGLIADAQFFKIFSTEFVKGNPDQAFDLPNSVVITASFAKKIFADTEPLGKTVAITSWSGEEDFIVTGIVQDVPTNSSLDYNYIINMLSNKQYMEERESDSWNNNSYATFLKLKNASQAKSLEPKLSDLIAQHSGANEDYPFKDTYFVQPLSELYLEDKINFDIGKKGNAQYLILFSTVAIIVLVLASVNYMNLAIARSIKRAKEVGLRKAIGAQRGQLIVQFLGESLLIALMGLVLAIAISYLLIPYFGYLMDAELVLDLFSNPLLLPILFGLVIIIGLLSGSYPALFMSSLKPINTLKGKVSDRSPKLGLQSVLVIIQYAASIVLIIGSFVVYLQFDYIQNKELGYSKDHILTFRTRSAEVRENIDLIKNDLLNFANIKSVSFTGDLPTNIGSSTLASLNEAEADDNNFAIYRTSTDVDFLNTFDLELLAGRFFSPDIETDKEKVVINESTVKALGWTIEEAVGNEFFRVGQGNLEVIGVIKDFHMFSLHLPIQPLMITYLNNYFNYAAVKISPDNIQNTLGYIEEIVQNHSDYPFEFQFLNAEFDKHYKKDIQMGKMFGAFTILSILISSFGLFGLAAYTTKQRTKEMGIRKVLGASMRSIVLITTKKFLSMVVIGFGIAVPIAWFLINVWLEDYAYKIELEWWIFAIAGSITAIIALGTVSSQSIKASLVNPVESLRSE